MVKHKLKVMILQRWSMITYAIIRFPFKKHVFWQKNHASNNFGYYSVFTQLCNNHANAKCQVAQQSSWNTLTVSIVCNHPELRSLLPDVASFLGLNVALRIKIWTPRWPYKVVIASCARNQQLRGHDVAWRCHPWILALLEVDSRQNEEQHVHLRCFLGIVQH